MHFWWNPCSRTQPVKPSKTIVCTMNLYDSTIRKKQIFDNFNDFFRGQFWHWFVMRFGIGLGFISEAFGWSFHVFSFAFLGMVFLSISGETWLSFGAKRRVPGASFYLDFPLFFAGYPFDYSCVVLGYILTPFLSIWIAFLVDLGYILEHCRLAWASFHWF